MKAYGVNEHASVLLGDTCVHVHTRPCLSRNPPPHARCALGPSACSINNVQSFRQLRVLQGEAWALQRCEPSAGLLRRSFGAHTMSHRGAAVVPVSNAGWSTRKLGAAMLHWHATSKHCS